MKKALLIEFDLRTGKRAGDISPRDKNLPCHSWQDLESDPAREIRLVEDDRDLSKYENTQGVTILNNKVEINHAINNIVSERYYIQDEKLFENHIKQKNINLEYYSGKKQQDVLRNFYERGILGIAKIKRRLL